MDQFTRRIIGFGVHADNVDGIALCCTFNHATSAGIDVPTYLSSDNDPLLQYQRWKTTVWIVEVEEIKNHTLSAVIASFYRTVDWYDPSAVS